MTEKVAKGQELYRVGLSEIPGGDDISCVLVVIEHYEGYSLGQFQVVNWRAAYRHLLFWLAERRQRFAGAMPHLDPDRRAGDTSFWIVVEPV